MFICDKYTLLDVSKTSKADSFLAELFREIFVDNISRQTKHHFTLSSSISARFFFLCLQPSGRGARQSGHTQRHGPHWRARIDERRQRGLHDDPRRRLVRPDGQWRWARYAPVRSQSLLAAAPGAERALERGGGAGPGAPAQGGGAGAGAGPV